MTRRVLVSLIQAKGKIKKDKKSKKRFSLSKHGRFVFGNVIRCSTLRLRVGYFIYSKLRQCYFIDVSS